MTVILLGLGDTLSAVIIVTVVATITPPSTLAPDNQSENINFPQSPHYNAPHHSPLNGHNPQCTVLICPESLLNDRTKPRQEMRPDRRVWSKQVINSKDKEDTISFVFFLKQDLYWTLWFIWCDIAPGRTTTYLYGPFHWGWAHTTVHCPESNIILSRLCWENVDRDKVAPVT